MGGVRRGGLSPIAPRREPIFVRGPKALRTPRPEGQVPPDWPGTYPEYVVYTTLISLGLRPDADFSYQSSQMGGRMELGGAVVDFLVYDPNRGINVVEPYWHLRRGARNIALDRYQQAALEARGIPMVYIDADDLAQDPTFIVREALAGRDHSAFTRGY